MRMGLFQVILFLSQKTFDRKKVKYTFVFGAGSANLISIYPYLYTLTVLYFAFCTSYKTVQVHKFKDENFFCWN